jgi:hypothetical protein
MRPGCSTDYKLTDGWIQARKADNSQARGSVTLELSLYDPALQRRLPAALTPKNSCPHLTLFLLGRYSGFRGHGGRRSQSCVLELSRTAWAGALLWIRCSTLSAATSTSGCECRPSTLRPRSPVSVPEDVFTLCGDSPELLVKIPTLYSARNASTGLTAAARRAGR